MTQPLLDRLLNQPDALHHLLAGLTEDQIRQRPQSDKWSISENLAHLSRYQDVFLARMKQIVAEEKPVFSRYVADNDPGFADWTLLPLPGLTKNMVRSREALNAYLSELPSEQLIRVGLHPAYGPMTVEGWTEFFLLHEAHHFFTILKLGGALRTNEQPMGLH
ncbi:DinB family protein [Spirosoma sp. KNUC1025]|uniref:DinB family protein n=1 Tax=Spirosoma sp. KNUC1025 TaxID=2894082 RepID=UPI003863F911|nr:DinB family protein [Spirosoma sp. KNUC1025]